jgi:hypothetical protein
MSLSFRLLRLSEVFFVIGICIPADSQVIMRGPGVEQGLLSHETPSDLGMNLYGKYPVDFKAQLGFAQRVEDLKIPRSRLSKDLIN